MRGWGARRPSWYRWSMTRLALLAAILTLAACDETSSAADGCRANTEIFVLPTIQEATKLHDAHRSRQMGTLNLLTAKYASKSAPAGTECDIKQESGDFVEVTTKPGGLTGWVPASEVRAAD